MIPLQDKALASFRGSEKAGADASARMCSQRVRQRSSGLAIAVEDEREERHGQFRRGHLCPGVQQWAAGKGPVGKHAVRAAPENCQHLLRTGNRFEDGEAIRCA